MDNAPQLHVESVRRVYAQGPHNAFTDLCRFRGRIFLTFRSCADGHMIFATSRIVVLASDDGMDWETVHSFHVPARDVRDPHFLIHNDRLFVYTGTWLVPRERDARNLNDHLGYAVYSDDGRAWTEPIMLEGTYGHYIWRAASHGGMAYLCARRRRGFAAGFDAESKPEIIQGAMLASDDGLVWHHHAFFTEDYGDETAFLFTADDSVLALARGPHGHVARICRARAPYRKWSRTPLARNVGGPLLVRWGEQYLVGGRRTQDEQPRTVLSWLQDDQLVDIAELPSDGDNSYPGFLELATSRALLSYYSSHEEGTAIYLAELVLG